MEFSGETTAAAFGATRLTATNALSSPRLNRVSFGLNARRTLVSWLWCEVSKEETVTLSPLVDDVDAPYLDKLLALLGETMLMHRCEAPRMDRSIVGMLSRVSRFR